MTSRRDLLKAMVAGATGARIVRAVGTEALAGYPEGAAPRTIRVALVQFDAEPEHIEKNVARVESPSQEVPWC